jgi:hypothetical protein
LLYLPAGWDELQFDCQWKRAALQALRACRFRATNNLWPKGDDETYDATRLLARIGTKNLIDLPGAPFDGSTR